MLMIILNNSELPFIKKKKIVTYPRASFLACKPHILGVDQKNLLEYCKRRKCVRNYAFVFMRNM